MDDAVAIFEKLFHGKTGASYAERQVTRPRAAFAFALASLGYREVGRRAPKVAGGGTRPRPAITRIEKRALYPRPM